MYLRDSSPEAMKILSWIKQRLWAQEKLGECTFHVVMWQQTYTVQYEDSLAHVEVTELLVDFDVTPSSLWHVRFSRNPVDSTHIAVFRDWRCLDLHEDYFTQNHSIHWRTCEWPSLSDPDNNTLAHTPPVICHLSVTHRLKYLNNVPLKFISSPAHITQDFKQNSSFISLMRLLAQHRNTNTGQVCDVFSNKASSSPRDASINTPHHHMSKFGCCYLLVGPSGLSWEFG